MANVKLFDQTGKEVSTVELNDAIFGIEPNESVVFDVVISQRASLRHICVQPYSHSRCRRSSS